MNYNTNKNSKARALLAVLIAAVILIGAFFMVRGSAEDQTVTAWVICQPGDYINIRARASKRSQAVGRLDCGDDIEITGETENGFAEIADLPMDTPDGAWIYAGYIVLDEPVWYGDEMEVIGTARVAARKNCCGAIRKLMQPGTVVQVFWKTDEWCVTNYGFIRTEYLEVGSV